MEINDILRKLGFILLFLLAIGHSLASSSQIMHPSQFYIDDLEMDGEQPPPSPIMNGDPTNNYNSVGAIHFNERTICTGTAIGQYTVLTAAHCFDVIGDSSAEFRLGGDARDPEKVFNIKRYVQHDEYNGWQCREALSSCGHGSHIDINCILKIENSNICMNDIAIFFVDKPIDVYFPHLHGSDPSHQSWKNNTELIFVGYGHGALDSTGVANFGEIKRKAFFPIKFIGAKRVGWSNPRLGTCQGDSGGPGFMKKNSNNEEEEMTLATITSIGEPRGCRFGLNVRVDQYIPWIKRNL